MTTAVVDQLVAHGFEPGAAQSRLALLERADEGFLGMAGTRPTWRWIVPGRLEVFGKHTDYAGGRSLIAAVPRGFAVVARARQDDVVHITDARNHETTTVDRAGVARPRRGWATYVSAVVQRLSDNFPGAPLGADIAFASDLPRAAGVSSSSALLVGVATALIRRADLTSRPEWRRAIASPLDQAGYFGCMENGRTYRSLRGARGVGTQGGSEDHTAMLLAKARCLRQFSYTPVSHEDDVELPASWRFVIASSGVHADKAGTVRDRFNRASRAVGVLLSIWNLRSGSPVGSLGAALTARPDAVAQLREWVLALSGTEGEGFTAQALTDRLDHFVREDARVLAAVRAFRQADLSELGRLAADSQRDAERLLGNQVPETTALVAEAVAAGSGACSSFGAGFGGSAWALVESADADAFGERWMASYREKFHQLTKAEWFSAIPAPPMIEIVAQE